MKNIFLILVFSIFLFSCNKEQNSETSFNEFDNIFTNSKNVDNYITVSQSNIAGNFSQVDFRKDIVDESSVNDIEISENFINDFTNHVKISNENYFSISRTQESSKDILDSFGKVFTLKSSNKDNGSDFYVPASISVTNKEEIKDVEIDSPLTIKWNPAPLNPNGKVVVTLINRSELPVGNEIINIDDISYTTIVEDNGQLIINQDKLTRFQTNKNLDVVIARGNQVYLNNSAITVITSDLTPTKTK